MDEHIGLGVLGRRSAYCGTLLLPRCHFYYSLRSCGVPREERHSWTSLSWQSLLGLRSRSSFKTDSTHAGISLSPLELSATSSSGLSDGPLTSASFTIERRREIQL